MYGALCVNHAILQDRQENTVYYTKLMQVQYNFYFEKKLVILVCFVLAIFA